MPLRYITEAVLNDPQLGDLAGLPGTWTNNDPRFHGHGWNIIALPFGPPGALGDFRLLLNQYHEELVFSLVDKNVPNRGQGFPGADQHVHALQYIQSITQLHATDAASLPDTSVVEPATPVSDDTPKRPGVAIHRELGLFLQEISQVTDGFDLARVSTIPHGDAVLALGKQVASFAGPPDFTDPSLAALFSSLPVGVGPQTAANVYLAPYFHFTGANKFLGLLDPTDPLALFTAAINPADVLHTQFLSFSTQIDTGGIQSIPFVTNNANAVTLNFGLWLQELHDGTKVAQYFQNVILKFLPVPGNPGQLIEWPHISFNTLVREKDAPYKDPV